MSKELNALLAPDRPLKALLITQQGFFHRQGWRHSFASLPVTYNIGMWCGGLALIVVLQHTAYATTTGSGRSIRQIGVDVTHTCTVMIRMAANARIPPASLTAARQINPPMQRARCLAAGGDVDGAAVVLHSMMMVHGSRHSVHHDQADGRGTTTPQGATSDPAAQPVGHRHSLTHNTMSPGLQWCSMVNAPLSTWWLTSDSSAWLSSGPMPTISCWVHKQAQPPTRARREIDDGSAPCLNLHRHCCSTSCLGEAGADEEAVPAGLRVRPHHRVHLPTHHHGQVSGGHWVAPTRPPPTAANGRNGQVSGGHGVGLPPGRGTSLGPVGTGYTLSSMIKSCSFYH